MVSFTELDGGDIGDVESEIWLACAGSLCSVPRVSSTVFYFPQGHTEQATARVHLPFPSPEMIRCRVDSLRYMADPKSDEVLGRIRLVPLRHWEPVGEDGEASRQEEEERTARPASFMKSLTQSDANNGGGFSVPRSCAESIFPALDYSEEPPVQNISVKDVHGEEFNFRYIYRGNPRRHLLTTGWSHFVNQKKLKAGDSVVFLRNENGELHVGIRRDKRALRTAAGEDDDGGSNGWDHHSASSGGNDGKIAPEDVVAAVSLAVTGQPFEVEYFPRASTPEFCVSAGAVTAAMLVEWRPGMRFKMAFEADDSSRVRWFTGTVAAFSAVDPIRWPQSLWRALQVTWDEAEVLRNVTRVCPWLVELETTMPNLHLPSSSTSTAPCKRPRIPSPYSDHFAFPSGHPLFNPAAPSPQALHGHHHDQLSFTFQDCDGGGGGASAGAPLGGIQGARHATFGPFFSDLRITNLQQQPGLLCPGVGLAAGAAGHAAPGAVSTNLTLGRPSALEHDDEGSSSLPVGATNADGGKPPPTLVLFGQKIVTEEPAKIANSSGVNSPQTEKMSSIEPCKVFVELQADTLDLSSLGSFEELYNGMSAMFNMEVSKIKTHVIYRGASGEAKHIGDEPFETFMKSARRITILGDAGVDNIGDRK